MRRMEPFRFPDGHFYSPTIDFEEVVRDGARIWPSDPIVQGVDFNEPFHRKVLTELFPDFIGDYDYPDKLEESDSLGEFFSDNPFFGWLDSRLLFVLMRAFAPRNIVEVGSGYSSLLMADVNRRFLAGQCAITCIEPFPRPFLKRGIPGIHRLIDRPVQQADPAVFETLGAGDFLFIDSSHVSKTGSDVNYLYFDILPRLKPGVKVHVHDILLPHDYPKDWVLNQGRSWNEQYILRALLMYSRAFHVLFGSSYAFHRFPDLVDKALCVSPGKGFAGGSFWLEVSPHE
jgi:hypothetical protein